MHVGKNFEVVQKRHEEFLKRLAEYGRASADVPRDLEALARKIAETEMPDRDILRTRDVANASSERFMVGLVTIDDGLNEVGGELEAAQRVCPPEIEGAAADAIAQSLEQVRKLRYELGRMRVYVDETMDKRLDLYGALLASRRIALYKAYAQRAGEAVEAIQSRVTAALAADRIARKVERWWHVAGVSQGLGRGLSTRKLQFTEALRTLRADLQEGRGLETELRDVRDLSPGARRQLEGDLKLYTKQLADEIARVEAGGWQAMLDRQKLLTARRKQIMDRYPTACRSAIEVYEQAAEHVVDAETFRPAEAAYLRQLDACTTEGV